MNEKPGHKESQMEIRTPLAQRKKPRNQAKRPLISMIDPQETDPLLLELKAEWMENEKIPRKKTKLAEIISKKNNIIGYSESSKRKLNMKRTMNPHKPKDIPLNPNAPFMKIQIHTIKFNGITPSVWATVTQPSHNRTVKNIITDAFSFVPWNGTPHGFG